MVTVDATSATKNLLLKFTPNNFKSEPNPRSPGFQPSLAEGFLKYWEGKKWFNRQRGPPALAFFFAFPPGNANDKNIDTMSLIESCFRQGVLSHLVTWWTFEIPSNAIAAQGVMG